MYSNQGTRFEHDLHEISGRFGLARAKKTFKRVGLAAYRFVPLKRHVAKALRPTPLPWSVKRHIRFDGVVTVFVDATHSFRVLAGGPIENNLFWNGYGGGWEGTSLRLWAAVAPSAHTIVDVGANTGVYALAARALNADAQIVAFEPSERVHQRLCANADLNGFDIETPMVAVSDHDGTATLYDSAQQMFYAASLEAPSGTASVIARVVRVVRLETYSRENGIDSIDLLKLDIEGHEPAAVEGMGDLLGRSRPTILVEVLSTRAADALITLLLPLGYEFYRIFEGRGIRRVGEFRAHEGHDRNYLVVQPGILTRANLNGQVLPG